MASHGAAKELANTQAPTKAKMPKILDGMTLRAGENKGVIAEHHFTHYEHKPEMHIFSDGEWHKLAAHIEKHLGIKMLGKASNDSTEPDEHKGEQE